MQVIKRIKKTKEAVERKKRQGKIIGFVPTMGYLHEGHLSLVEIARKSSDYLIVSIFVNPTQFGPNEDYNNYPRDLKKDARLLEDMKVDLLFLPSVREIYPQGYKTYIEVTELDNVLCGASRPGHLKGVATVVLKLFNIVKPDIAVFGRKDYQQGVIIKKMVMDLNLDVKILLGPTVRERDGLAMSSRNTYLSPEERKEATILYQSLKWTKEAFQKGLRNPQKAIDKMRAMITAQDGKIDYIQIVDKDSLIPARQLKRGTLIALAVYFGRARLIDNIII